MKMSWLQAAIVSLLAVLLMSTRSMAAPLVLDSLPTHSLSLNTLIETWHDRQETTGIQTLLDAGDHTDWQPVLHGDVNFGFDPNPLWIRFSLKNVAGENLEPLLVLASPTLDLVDIYQVDAQTGTLTQLTHTGNDLPFHSRQVDNRNYVQPLKIRPGQQLTYYLRIEEAGSLQAPLALWDREAYYGDYQYEQSKFALYFGLLITLIAYNLFLAMSLRSAGHRYYVGYVVALLLIQASQTGFGSQFIWPEAPVWAYLSVQIGVPVSLMFAGLFSIEALNLRLHPRLAQWNKLVIYSAIAVMILGLVVPLSTHLKLTVASGMLGSLAFLITGLLTWRTGDLASRLYTLAWVALAAGTTVYGLNKFGLMPANAITNNAFWFGSALEGLMLSFSLAARMSELQKTKLELQSQLVQDREKQFELETKAIEFEAKNKTRDEFIATFSHEIRTPINGVLGMSELLAETALDKTQISYLHAIKSSGESLLLLINSVLDFSKIEAERLELEKLPTELHALVNDSCTLFETVAEEKGLGFGIRYEGQIPAAVILDPLRVKQILLNLLSNAFKFTASGSVELVVHAKQEYLRFEVTDTGIGIAEENQRRLFESFYQADKSTTRRYGGTGLGLAISKKLVEMHGGTMGVTSDLECGSTFWFEIPLLVAEPSTAEPVLMGKGLDSASPTKVDSLGSHGRVLVAEDNQVNSMVIRRYLERLGCRVDLSSNGQEAVEAFVSDPRAYDLVFLDYEMPVLDGYEATLEIRRYEADRNLEPTPIVGISAHTLADTIERLRHAGMNDFLPKPIKEETLKSILSKHIPQIQTA